jgi:hypothetical protein
MTYRQLRYESGVEEQLASLEVDARRFDEVMEAINDVLSSAPEAFPVIAGTKLSFCKTNEFVGTNFDGIPSMVLYFHYDLSSVYILSVEESEGEAYGF